MAVGPVQLLVLGFNGPDFHGEIVAELDRLRASGTVRVIDALAVYKDAEALEIEGLGAGSGMIICTLVGLRVEGEEQPETDGDTGNDFFSEQEEWDVIDDIPNDSAAALILLEHRWAVPLREALARAGGYRISDGFISPLDLAEIGLMTAEEARELSYQ